MKKQGILFVGPQGSGKSFKMREFLLRNIASFNHLIINEDVSIESIKDQLAENAKLENKRFLIMTSPIHLDELTNDMFNKLDIRYCSYGYLRDPVSEKTAIERIRYAQHIFRVCQKESREDVEVI